MLAEAVERLRRERAGVLAEDEKAVVADVGHAGFGILRYDDTWRDVSAAVLGAVGRDRPAPNVDVVARDHLVLARRLPGDDRRRDRVVEPAQHLVEDRVLVGLEGEQRLATRGIDA